MDRTGIEPEHMQVSELRLTAWGTTRDLYQATNRLKPSGNSMYHLTPQSEMESSETKFHHFRMILTININGTEHNESIGLILTDCAVCYVRYKMNFCVLFKQIAVPNVIISHHSKDLMFMPLLSSRRTSGRNFEFFWKIDALSHTPEMRRLSFCYDFPFRELLLKPIWFTSKGSKSNKAPGTSE